MLVQPSVAVQWCLVPGGRLCDAWQHSPLSEHLRTSGDVACWRPRLVSRVTAWPGPTCHAANKGLQYDALSLTYACAAAGGMGGGYGSSYGSPYGQRMGYGGGGYGTSPYGGQMGALGPPGDCHGAWLHLEQLSRGPAVHDNPVRGLQMTHMRVGHGQAAALADRLSAASCKWSVSIGVDMLVTSSTAQAGCCFRGPAALTSLLKGVSSLQNCQGLTLAGAGSMTALDPAKSAPVGLS